MGRTRADNTIKVLITIKGGIVEEIAATGNLDITICDRDGEQVGELRTVEEFDALWLISEEKMEKEIKRLKKGARA